MASRWQCAGASVIGMMHERHGGRCEDAWVCQRGEPGDGHRQLLAVCVADGAGSARFGRAGARVTSGVAADWLCRSFAAALSMPASRLAEDLLSAIRSRLGRVARRLDAQLHELASTLIAVAVSSSGEWLAVHLGDGGILGRFENEMRIISGPKKGEFANETFFVSDKDAVDHLCIIRGSNTDKVPSAFLLFTDGLEGTLVQRSSRQIAPAAATMAAWLDECSEQQVTLAIEENLKSAFRQHTADDCTLVIMTE